MKSVTFLICITALACAGCASDGDRSSWTRVEDNIPNYIIGPGDTLNVFVWGNPELTVSVPVKPDGRITTPLVEDVVASGKTSTQLAREIEQRLRAYVKAPVVTVSVTQFVGRYSEQIRVVGAATKPTALPYSQKMTVLDLMIAVGGLSEFSAGNRAHIVRTINGGNGKIPVRLADLLDKGDLSQNFELFPGDILVIPESIF